MKTDINVTSADSQVRQVAMWFLRHGQRVRLVRPCRYNLILDGSEKQEAGEPSRTESPATSV